MGVMKIESAFLAGALLFLLGPGQTSSVKHFISIGNSSVPERIVQSSEVCDDTPQACWRNFVRYGKGWAGDVNDDGVDEFIVFPGLGSAGSGGYWYFLFQKRDSEWKTITAGGPPSGWQTFQPRFDILPIKHAGYHDLRLEPAWCVKWDGKQYVDYTDTDYHRLLPAFFNASDPGNAEILWDIRYRGLTSFHFEPMWSPGPDLSKHSVNVVVNDPEFNLRWLALFKGGVWGVRGNRGFLLLPQPAYKGSEKMEINGDWLIIHGEYDDPDKVPAVVARYNRRTHELTVSSNSAS
ncbi:MAG: hypothetical protein ACYDCD_11815 [Candidatus Acidiferrales bacterium]